MKQGNGILGIALIGCGGMGRREAKELTSIPEARLVAVSDVVEAAAETFGREMGVPWHIDHRAVLERPEVDAVIVATPNGFHTEIVTDAANAGKHIFCEKPFAFTVAECDQMIASAEQNDVRLMVGHVLRLMPQFQRVADIFESGALGKPVSAQVTHVSWLGDPTARYRLKKATTGGLLYDITIHEIDFLQKLCGPAESVFAFLDNKVQPHIDYEDLVQLLIRFKSGAVGHIFSSLASTIPSSGGTIVGERGTLRYQENVPYRRGGVITYRPLGVDGQPQEPVSEEVLQEGQENGYVRELRSFVEWVLYGWPPLLTAAEGRAAVQVVEAAYRSAETGKRVRIE
ncbi:MAG TPA: Gfo/Idh/MocA family oxidoreductase [Chloroflexota bacterium]|nr:Gfo/Idh/MocA family oxidoreductase [Chloroflexota bacterium]